jgi:sporulation protein YlmC with PRC-barrel domain
MANATPSPKRLIASSKVSGTAVYNLKGEHLGHVDEVMIDKQSGAVAYAVLAFGGFLGFNDHHFPLPWSALRYDAAMDGYVVDIDRERLESAPRFTPGSAPDAAEPGWAHIDNFYRNPGA